MGASVLDLKPRLKVERCDSPGCGLPAAQFVVGSVDRGQGLEILLVCSCRFHQKAAIDFAVKEGYLDGQQYAIEALPEILAFIETEWKHANVKRA